MYINGNTLFWFDLSNNIHTFTTRHVHLMCPSCVFETRRLVTFTTFKPVLKVLSKTVMYQGYNCCINGTVFIHHRCAGLVNTSGLEVQNHYISMSKNMLIVEPIFKHWNSMSDAEQRSKEMEFERGHYCSASTVWQILTNSLPKDAFGKVCASFWYSFSLRIQIYFMFSFFCIFENVINIFRQRLLYTFFINCRRKVLCLKLWRRTFVKEQSSSPIRI